MKLEWKLVTKSNNDWTSRKKIKGFKTTALQICAAYHDIRYYKMIPDMIYFNLFCVTFLIYSSFLLPHGIKGNGYRLTRLFILN